MCDMSFSNFFNKECPESVICHWWDDKCCILRIRDEK